MIDWAKINNRKISIRLVKGAYWDTEIKHAQIEGHEGYPVFTRKENTDLSYIACAKLLLDNRDVIAPMFGTHNAQTTATIMDLADNDKNGLMFQRLHGMGGQLFDQIHSMDFPTCVYAPVGTHKYLLAYLVRRLLENGANSSFVNKMYDKETHHDVIGNVYHATTDDINNAYNILNIGFEEWNGTSIKIRAAALNKIADLYEENTPEIMALLIREAGKTIPDAIAEVREAVDFCRYYAVEAQKHFVEQELEGPTGERNTLTCEGRGIFTCISPWNFPFAIFTGQIVAALVAGNAVISKPAEQTPSIAKYAIDLMIRAGIPANAIALLQGDGEIGAQILNHPSLGGVAFTGSTDVAKIIQRQLAERDGAILPLIAETGGLNAMIVDSTALPEQVTDDVLYSAFGSSGQRCSALRILCIQDDVADEIVTMIHGAMEFLTLGDPAHLSTDIGPIIDDEARSNLVDYALMLKGTAKNIISAPHDNRLDAYGTYFTPIAAEINDIDLINIEAFGPILHIIRYKESELDNLIDKINAKGFGLTFGLHSRIRNATLVNL